jgi:hypothetical protein
LTEEKKNIKREEKKRAGQRIAEGCDEHKGQRRILKDYAV